MKYCLPFLLLYAWLAHADTLYKCADGKGRVTYTNQAESAGLCRLLTRSKPKTDPAAKPQARSDNFPRVSAAEQQQRDIERRQILNNELANEQRLLVAERGQNPTNRDAVRRHERNIAALEEELRRIR